MNITSTWNSAATCASTTRFSAVDHRLCVVARAPLPLGQSPRRVTRLHDRRQWSYFGPRRSAVAPRREARAAARSPPPRLQATRPFRFLGKPPLGHAGRAVATGGDAGAPLPRGRGFVPRFHAGIHNPPRLLHLVLILTSAPLSGGSCTPLASALFPVALPLVSSGILPPRALLQRFTRHARPPVLFFVPPPVTPRRPSGERLPSCWLQGVVAATRNLQRGVPL